MVYLLEGKCNTSDYVLKAALCSILCARNVKFTEHVCDTSEWQVVVITIFHSPLTTGIVTRVSRWVSHVEQELSILLEHMSTPPLFSGVRVARSLCVMFCKSLLVFLSLFFWPLSSLSVFDLQILNIPLVSSNVWPLYYLSFDLRILITPLVSSPIRCGFAPSFVNYNKGGLDKVYRLLAQGR